MNSDSVAHLSDLGFTEEALAPIFGFLPTCQIPSPGLNPTSITLTADRALYLAKQQGRDRLVSFLE